MNQTDKNKIAEPEKLDLATMAESLELLDLNTNADPFGANATMSTAYRRAERMVFATYLVTNFIAERETLRAHIRDGAQTLLADILTLREGMATVGPRALSNVIAHIRRILTLLDIAHASGYISRMNNEVLKSAYLDLASYLTRALNEHHAEALPLTRDNFISVKSSKGQIASQGQNDKGHIKDKNVLETKSGVSRASNMEAIDGASPALTAFAGKSVRARGTAARRRSQILDVLGKVQSASVADLKEAIPGLNEKMIQRELQNLIRTGTVHKEGEKRWTTYSLSY